MALNPLSAMSVGDPLPNEISVSTTAAQAIPNDASGESARLVYIFASAPAGEAVLCKPGDSGVSIGGSNDGIPVGADTPVLLHVAGRSHVAMKSTTGTITTWMVPVDNV